jgi:hypothetical protein
MEARPKQTMAFPARSEPTVLLMLPHLLWVNRVLIMMSGSGAGLFQRSPQNTLSGYGQLVDGNDILPTSAKLLRAFAFAGVVKPCSCVGCCREFGAIMRGFELFFV